MQKSTKLFVLFSLVLFLGIGIINTQAFALPPSQCWDFDVDEAEAKCQEYCTSHGYGDCKEALANGCTCSDGFCKCIVKFLCLNGNYDGGGKATSDYPDGECNHTPPYWWDNNMP